MKVIQITKIQVSNFNCCNEGPTANDMATQYFTVRSRNVLLLLLRSVEDGLREFPFSGIVLVEMHATSRRFKYLSRTRFLKFFIVEEML